jgi:hypothetical protein
MEAEYSVGAIKPNASTIMKTFISSSIVVRYSESRELYQSRRSEPRGTRKDRHDSEYVPPSGCGHCSLLVVGMNFAVYVFPAS